MKKEFITPVLAALVFGVPSMVSAYCYHTPYGVRCVDLGGNPVTGGAGGGGCGGSSQCGGNSQVAPWQAQPPMFDPRAFDQEPLRQLEHFNIQRFQMQQQYWR